MTPVGPDLGIIASSDVNYYRITSLKFRTARKKLHTLVVNGAGAISNYGGGRYNYPGARAVYLADTPETCFAEGMFYFHRDALTQLDTLHAIPTPAVPPFRKRFILWELTLKNPVPNVFDLSGANASAAGVFPCLLFNPHQDYNHLKDRRAAIQSAGYGGIRAPSARAVGAGATTVLFDDQSKNVRKITPHEVEFRLITPARDPIAEFTNHVIERLDYGAGEARVLEAGPGGVLDRFAAWTLVPFHH